MNSWGKPDAGRRRKERCLFAILHLAAGIDLLALLGIGVFLAWRGLPVLSWAFLTTAPRAMMTEGGIFPCIAGTCLLAAGALSVAFPLGVAAAIFLHEYAENARLASVIRLGVTTLAGVPSVVFGLFGMAFFVTWCGLGISLLSGMLTLGLLTLPIIMSTTEEALRTVPRSLREASLALGASTVQTLVRVVIPAALPGMLTGGILGVARAAGETSVIMFTAAVFVTPHLPHSLLSPVMALPYHIYVLATSGLDIEKTRPLQYGASIMLVVVVLGVNLLAVLLRDRLQQRHGR